MARYGGDTSSVLVASGGGDKLILDAGTGIRKLGERLPRGLARIDILLTHLHMDHIQGLGFFPPLADADIDVHIWGPPSSTHPLEARLARYLSPPLFPVHFRDLPAVTCHECPTDGFEIGPFSIQTSLVCHPDPTLGYRITLGDRALTYIPDHEPALCLVDGAWPEHSWISGHDLALDADLLLHDAQYSDEEYARSVGFGHCSYRHAFAFAALAHVRELVPFHHDPAHDDQTLDRLFEDTLQCFKPGFQVSKGCEGAVFQLG
ncbi:MAG: MBL fold metallo-hydrolase [Alphaproteobacteria bacterium]